MKKNSVPEEGQFIVVRGARQNNLKGINLSLPLNSFNVITGLSGSGKSSLAFDTLYAEGQRRYVETFSPYARQFLDRMDKPQVDSIEGIPPAIAIEQKNTIKTSRSTVGTMTELTDYIKLLFARCAVLYCPGCQDPVVPDTPPQAWEKVFGRRGGADVLITFQVSRPESFPLMEAIEAIQKQGYQRLWCRNEVVRCDDPQTVSKIGKPQFLTVIQDRIKVEAQNRTRFIESLEVAFRMGRGKAECVVQGDHLQTLFFSRGHHCATCNKDYREATTSLFSFNNPVGACPTCKGFGRTIEIDYQLVIPDKTKTIEGGLVRPWQSGISKECQDDLLMHCRRRRVPTDVPFKCLDPEIQQWVIDGDPDYDSDNPNDWKRRWYGVKGYFRWLESNTYKMHVRVLLSRYRSYQVCPTCKGGRFQPEVLNFKIVCDNKDSVQRLDIAQWYEIPVKELVMSVEKMMAPSNDNAVELLQKEIISRLQYLVDVGLGYLNLNRPARTLSGGEIARVNLTTCLGTSLVNTLFVLDEPTIGLHARDVDQLIKVMHRLRDAGNTLIVVEHDSAVMQAADHITDLGPGRGRDGGNVVFQGNYSRLIQSRDSLTARYLRGEKKVYETHAPRLRLHETIKISGAAANNLKGIDVEIPLRSFTCVTGVSGSGKSTLVHRVLYQNWLVSKGQPSTETPGECSQIEGLESIDEIIMVDQSPIGRTPRSNPALYIGVFDGIRALLAQTEDAQKQGFKAGDFSFNAGNGRCLRCSGTGYEKIEMQFLSDVFVKCPECEGRRYQPAVLKIRYQNKSVGEILETTVSEAVEFFQARENIAGPLRLLERVGLGYLKLGQPLTTLSGGESQRLKLVGYLSGKPIDTRDEEAGSGGNDAEAPEAEKSPRRARKRVLFIFDEPTTGLHFDDIHLLLNVLHDLVEQEHSVLVIEHNLHVVETADWIIDLGPEGGNEGGQVVCCGTPEQVMAHKDSHTGQMLLAQALHHIESDSMVSEGEKVAEDAGQYTRAMDRTISIHGAREHNLKNIDVRIPLDQMVVITGISGSGKSTLAFDLVFAEGQRRFMDSMSAYARQFVEQLSRPDVDHIQNIPPTVAIEQRVTRGGGKSTVSTVTEIYHFIRLLYAKLGVPYSPSSGLPLVKQTSTEIYRKVQSEIQKRGMVSVMAPLIRARKGFHTEVAQWAVKKGYAWLRVDGEMIEAKEMQKLDRYQEHTIEVLIGIIGKNQKKIEKSLETLVSEALQVGQGTFFTYDNRGHRSVYSTERTDAATGESFEELEPSLFSFNSPKGWCSTCRGYGVIWRNDSQLDEDRFRSELEKEVAEDLQKEEKIFEDEDSDEVRCPDCGGARINPLARSVRIPAGEKWQARLQAIRDVKIARTVSRVTEACGPTIVDLMSLTVDHAHAFVKSLKYKGREGVLARDILPEILSRLHFMHEVGLGYLSLDRSASTLSGGEAQRIRLAAQLGSNLRGVLYVLDEPTIGLHPRDNEFLLDTLESLKKRGNSLVLVEHDEETMRRADHIIDLGPGAGVHGGQVIAEGHWEELLKHPDSLTGQYLHKTPQHPLRGSRREINENTSFLTLEGAFLHNLKNLKVRFPLNRFIAVTGVSGSGKSTLIREVLYKSLKSRLEHPKANSVELSGCKKIKGFDHLNATYEVDQSPIGKTSRSTPSTYLGFMDEIRKLFAATPAAQIRGYGPGRFSYNNSEGQCPACSGAGEIKLEMNFLPPVFVHCETCNGARYNAETLEVTYQDRNIAQILNMSVDEASEFFANHSRLKTGLNLLKDTGLGYLRLGQTSPTLSGGEAQRMKLVAELAARSIEVQRRKGTSAKGNLYILEEPTIGLHMADVEKLIQIIHRLVDSGHTVVVIEHNLELIAEADWVIDMGPEPGIQGGEIVVEGTPEVVARDRKSHTGRFLREILMPGKSRQKG